MGKGHSFPLSRYEPPSPTASQADCKPIGSFRGCARRSRVFHGSSLSIVETHRTGTWCKLRPTRCSTERGFEWLVGCGDGHGDKDHAVETRERVTGSSRIAWWQRTRPGRENQAIRFGGVLRGYRPGARFAQPSDQPPASFPKFHRLEICRT